MIAMRRASLLLRRGVTLTELMVTIVIAVLILSFAAPSFMDQIERQRLLAVKDELVAALHLTRMETLSRDARGFVKPGSSTEVTCYVFGINSLTTNTPPETCDCTQADGSVCSDPGAKLLGVVRVPRSTGVTLSRLSDDAPEFVYFNRATGSLEVIANDLGDAVPVDYGFRLRGSRGGEIRVDMSVGGRPSTCQVGANNLGLGQCP